MSGLLRWAAAGAAAALVAALAPAGGQADEALKGRICYARKEADGYQLRIMDADGKNDHVIPNQPAKMNLMPAWSPDGKQIAFMNSVEEGTENPDSFGLYVIGADGSGLRRLAEDEKLAALPAWSPDGKRILFTADREGGPVLRSINADGSGAQDFPTGLKFAIAPFFSPDGKRLAFTGTNEINASEKSIDLYVGNADGTGAEKLTMGDGFAIGSPGGWSPDGKAIAFVRANPENKTADLHVWLVDDKVDNRLMDLKIGEGFLQTIPFPGWSPDGKWLVLSQLGDGGKAALWRISADGKTQEKITPADASCHSPAWSRN
jgi:TolB protein